MERNSGILMHISSLPSQYGIGNFGKEAYEFIDFLVESGQKYWQILPLGPTSYGDSPYQSFCSFAGNPYFIDFDSLIEKGVLKACEVDTFSYGDQEAYVDYSKIYGTHYQVLYQAFKVDDLEEPYEKFCQENQEWLMDYSLFMALKKHFHQVSWLEWEDDTIRLREPEAIEYYKKLLKDEIQFQCYMQYLFFEQWNKLKKYANKKGIKIIGDIPIYVAMDSSDTWSSPQNFQFDKDAKPKCVAGVPPDYFSVDGQLWGNPIFDWDYMKKDKFSWWKRRIVASVKLYDVIRIDHFRGLESYFSIDADATTARDGVWRKGPDQDFVDAVKEVCPEVDLIAEDLGFVTEEVKNLLNYSGFPGMKVLQFAFDAREPGEYMPHNYPYNSVVYTGTHDNPTIMEWFEDADSEDIALAKTYLGLNQEEGLHMGMIRGALYTNAKLCVIPIQDYLALGKEARMNTPSVLGGNWQFRVSKDMLDDKLSKKIKKYTQMYGR